ncbi:MAG: NifB/NifX family molybdenum-iron cluster-binding protein, partial [Candidatus Gastranaerophilales bacterium]|nr:NifB/NifX family molybdenum-iron cluster-binding protein [Candidatus Gastranaerophilales bacterium]
MKIAITANSKDLDSKVDLRFGRAFGFIIYDLDNDKYDFVDNVQNIEAAQGAGIQAAQTVVNQDIEALITGHCGPKAFKVLSAADIKIYVGAQGTVKETIEKFKN